jgi:hypothetical protein
VGGCEYGHRFRPFKRSRDLYCRECGALRLSRSSPSMPGLQTLRPMDVSEREVPGSSDPYLDAARGIVESTQFEREVDLRLDAAGAFGPIRDRLRAEALLIGPGLEMDQFAAYAKDNVDAMPVEAPMEDLIDEFGGE